MAAGQGSPAGEASHTPCSGVTLAEPAASTAESEPGSGWLSALAMLTVR
jgi:hypothetical protein